MAAGGHVDAGAARARDYVCISSEADALEFGLP